MSTTSNNLGSNLGMAAQLAGQSLRFGWYFALQRLVDRRTEQLGGPRPKYRPTRRPIADYMRGRDQRQVTLLDVACGTGRFLRQVRLAYPAMTLKGLDLSRAYLDEATRHLKGLRTAEMIEAPAERMPLADASV